jgi:hypothetical protein
MSKILPFHRHGLAAVTLAAALVAAAQPTPQPRADARGSDARVREELAAGLNACRSVVVRMA